MTPHDRALELLRFSERDERAAHVLQGDATIDIATIAFHYQQAAEKLLKALLAEHDVDYPRTHNLDALVELAENAGYRIPVPRGELIRLTPFAVTFRYEDDDESGRVDLVRVKRVIQQLREWVQATLG